MISTKGAEFLSKTGGLATGTWILKPGLSKGKKLAHLIE